LHRFCLYLSGDAALADDLVSETFLRAWTVRDRLEMPTVRAYLFTIARNLYHKLGARAKPVALPKGLVDGKPTPAVTSSARNELDGVLARLQTLSEIDRAVLLMQALDALPYEAIARAVGLSVGAVKVKIHRARLKLAAAREE
jgi:RNA polymerase sigma-70 factor (ECF subfamily)